MEAKEEPKEEIKIEIPKDATLPEGGEVVLSSSDFSDVKYQFANKYGDYALDHGILHLDVKSTPESFCTKRYFINW